MFVDASAIVAIIAREDDAESLATRLATAPIAYTSALSLYEATLALVRARNMSFADAQTAFARFTVLFRVHMTPITEEIGRAAIDAFERYGRGRHPARLNMGDCFSYACARNLGVPLLCKGDDFPRTDIERV